MKIVDIMSVVADNNGTHWSCQDCGFDAFVDHEQSWYSIASTSVERLYYPSVGFSALYGRSAALYPMYYLLLQEVYNLMRLC